MKEVEKSSGKILSMWQIERLCNIVYLDGILEGAKKEKRNLSVLVPELCHQISMDSVLPCGMSRQQWRSVLDSIQQDASLMSLYVADIQQTTTDTKAYLKGQRAVSFGDKKNRFYVIFRGTNGDSEWLDNAMGMLEADTIQQKAALNYLLYVRQKYSPSYVAVAGHSKGGNKAQYITVVAPKGAVDYGLSIDGQGFSADFMEKYQAEIKSRDNLHLIAEQRDFVNSLGKSVGTTVYYRGYRGFADTNGSLYGCELPYFHCPDALRIFDAQIAPSSGPGPIPLLVNQFIESFLGSDQYSREEKLKMAEFFVGYRMENPKESISSEEAWLNLGMEIVHLVATNLDFVQKIEDTLYLETNTIFATVFKNADPKEIFEWGESDDVDFGSKFGDSIDIIWEIIRKKDRIAEIPAFLRNMTGLLKKILLRCFEFVEGQKTVIVIGIFIIQMLMLMQQKALDASGMIGEFMADRVLPLKQECETVLLLFGRLEDQVNGKEEKDLLKLAKSKMQELAGIGN